MARPRASSRATIADVARRAGVSTATVSRLLNGTGPVADGTAALVRAAVSEMDYTPRAAAQSLARGKTDTLGLLLPDIGGVYFSPLVRGIEAAAQRAGFDLLIHATLPDSARPANFRRIGQRNTDGLLIFAHGLNEAELANLHGQRFPMVLLLQPSPASMSIPSVNLENKKGARKIMDHLIEVHGCRRIGFLRGPDGNSDSDWRERGYREALQAHGIAFDPSLVAKGGFNEREARAAVAGWLRQGISMDAIFAGDDESAFGALQSLQEGGLRVPEDLAIAGFDDVYLSQYVAPPLTTVRAPIEEVGRLATELLIDLIQKDGQAAAAGILLPTELVIRRSCGCPLAPLHAACNQIAPRVN